MRREVIETKLNSNSCIELKNELILTEQCLREHPKSYAVWHHRTWIIDHISDPDWKTELALCAECLNKDERNFHCWDYRNFIVNKAKVSDKDEFEFSTTKILKNFSNYSSWHYRSKILSKMFPDNNNKLPIREDKHKEELDLVMNATFTDPNDSSAWFYQRWLLESQTTAKNEICRIQLNKSNATITFHKETHIDSSVSFLINDTEIKCDWKTLNNKFNNNKCSKYWFCDFSDVLESLKNETEINLQFEGNSVPLVKSETNNSWIYKGKPILYDSYNESQLREQLQNYKQLSEMEPDNKWALLTGIFLMKNIDFMKFYSNILEDLNTLMKVDSLRLNYYKDLRSKNIMEYNLIWQTKSKADQFILNLSGMNLTAIYYEQYFSSIEEVDLGDNDLQRSLHLLYPLQTCTNLSLMGNKIKSLSRFPKLCQLQKLSLRNNDISDIEEVLKLVIMHNLKQLDLRDNPVCQTKIVEQIRSITPGLELLVD